MEIKFTVDGFEDVIRKLSDIKDATEAASVAFAMAAKRAEPAPPGSVEARLQAAIDAQRALTGNPRPYLQLAIFEPTPDLLAYVLEHGEPFKSYVESGDYRPKGGTIAFQYNGGHFTVHLNDDPHAAEVDTITLARPRPLELVPPDPRDELVIVQPAEPEPPGEPIPPPPEDIDPSRYF